MIGELTTNARVRVLTKKDSFGTVTGFAPKTGNALVKLDNGGKIRPYSSVSLKVIPAAKSC